MIGLHSCVHDFRGRYNERELAGQWSVMSENYDAGGSSTLPLVTPRLANSISIGSA